ncbi:MAG TPA: SUMF1/EgtB/PvdO family nonheme iron enzyme [Thermoanaerobaculia bacterium]|nr:SUMF1/EgtB/PvdO family nonheme iron enzyme [Thermoanaerobaculia bacterium]
MHLSGYLNFDIFIEPVSGRYSARVHGPAGEAQTEFQKPFTDDDLQKLWKQTSAEEYHSPGEWIENLGEKLFLEVFRGNVDTSFRLSLREARGAGKGLRLRFHLTQVPELAAWPWEYLCDNGHFFGMSVETPVVRYLDTSVPQKPLKTELPLRVLVLMASPRGYEPLAVEEEWQRLSQALDPLRKDGLIELELLPEATLTALDEDLRRRPCNVLHFVGHGKFYPNRKDGAILLLDERGGAKEVRGKQLGGLLAGRKLPRLVVLNACEGARNPEEDSFAGVAPNLVRHGLAAVVAMQFPITDAAAIDFSERFYQMLAEGLPVDSAVTEARREMSFKHDIEWGAPVLYMRAPEGCLFELPAKGDKLGIDPYEPVIPMSKRLTTNALPSVKVGGKLIRRSLIALSLVGVSALGIWLARTDECPPKEVDMDFVLIPAGNFLMGSQDGEDDEKPVRQVTISQPFCLGVYEVTQEQWEQVMGPNKAQVSRRGDLLPITGISYDDVQEFLQRLNKEEGKNVFRLPTEAEWEYAARGPDGESSGGNCLHDDPYDGLARVGAYQTNDWGAYDMLGNVWEWVGDWYDETYPKEPSANPTGPKTGTERVKRGGGFNAADKHCRPARRNSHKPDSHENNLGFRVLRELEPPTISSASSP